MEYKVHEIVRHAKENVAQINYMWVPARPVPPKGFYGLKIRIKGALKVLLGKADTVVWPAGQ